jgi:Zn-dependent peptidase ImmA (M78 family)
MSNTIRQLRDLVPLRPMSMAEAMRIADLQASRLLSLLGIEVAPVPETAISDLPRVHVERMTPAPVSGAAQWSKGRWLIIVNGAEPWGRQRFSMAHEFKHVLDSPFIGYLYPTVKGQNAHDRAEQICDYFAACLLMPRAWVKHLYCNDGIQDLRRLARRFEVSAMAMQVRLLQLGLVEPPARCAAPPKVAA